MAKLTRFKAALLFVGVMLTLLWGIALVQTALQLRHSPYSRPPSGYDTGQPLMVAASASNGRPLLVEFYSDQCTRCHHLTPMVHSLMQQNKFKSKLVWAMVNADDTNNQLFMQLFQVKTLPALFVFKPTSMKKHPVALPATQVNYTIDSVSTAIEQSL
jgi:thiol-disulfide isomerase/thioredoxin